MKRLLIFVFACLFFIRPAYSQYYYNDLVTAKENMKKQASYRLNKVHGVRYSSLDGDNQPIEGFSCNQKISSNYLEIATTTTAPVGGTTENTSFFNANGQLVKSVDTADGNSTTLTYQYDADNRIRNIVSRSVSPGNYINKEEHIWSYNSTGRPVKMLKVKNDSDTTYISFVPDEQGNPGEERSTHAGQEQPTIFYYYDNKNQLTDIVRYNNRAKRLLPDYIFEYTDSNNLKSMLVTIEGGSDYQKWNYTYNDKGLKTKDECYSKTKVLIGKVLYDYQY